MLGSLNSPIDAGEEEKIQVVTDLLKQQQIGEQLSQRLVRSNE